MKPPITIEDLPEPIIEYILSYLSPYRDLKQCMQVNKSWYRYVNDVVRKTQRDFFNAVCHMSVQWSHLEAEPGPTITKRYSHSACCRGNSMYIFGGCTTANTTFNDLWRLDLGTRCWIRPLATGTYPPPKACATLVCHSDNLILFGGWTHTAPFPLQQVFRVFNQIHVYNTTTNRWSQLSTATFCPAMAGHSATVHGEYMVVFGGVQKKETDGPFVISNDIWILDLKLYKWHKQKTTTDVEPPPRYGHSQIPIDKNHLLIIGGNGGSNMLYNDIWLLKMDMGPGGVWEWQKMDIQGKENGAPHLAFHPACKVGSQVVVMSRTHKSRSSTSFPTMMRAPNMIWIPPPPREEDKNNMRNTKRSAPEVENCVNGKRGVLKRASERYNKVKAPMSSSDEEELQDASKKAALHILNHPPSDKSQDLNSPGPSVSGAVPSADNDSHSVPSSSRSPDAAAPDDYPRDGRYPGSEHNSSANVQCDDSASSAAQSSLGALRSPNNALSVPRDIRKPNLDQNSVAHARRNRQRQLEGIARMEERLNQLKAGNASYPAKQVPQKFVKQKSARAAKRPMCMYVLDISTVFDGFLTWRTIKNQSPTAPEEIILYSLVLGKGEVIMFGGIQKDLTSQKDTQTVPEIVSNSLHFMTAERVVI